MGQLINFISDDRYAVGDMKQYRFSTPLKNYTEINGFNIWQYGETIWHYPEGEFVYGKFRLKSIEYNVTAFKKLVMKKKKLTPSQKKVAQVMNEFKEGDLHSGRTDTIVTNPKQAIAIALSEADELKKRKK